ncbi:HTH_48 domain-containing protein [Trichonephila clavipes]|nr:HTH_48 domain-containing protein [Trichonephila clavipes]
MSCDRNTHTAVIIRSYVALFLDLRKMALLEQRCTLNSLSRSRCLGKTPIETFGMLTSDLRESRQLLDDNAPAHQSQLVKQFLVKTHTNVLPLSPYSPDLATCDIWLFPSLKKHVQGRRFESSYESKVASQEVAKNGYQLCFQKLCELWQKCIVTQGNYFEGGCASVLRFSTPCPRTFGSYHVKFYI